MAKKMTDEEIVALVNDEFESAMGSESGEIGKERAKAYDYYLGKKFGNEEEGQSSVVTSDVADAVDGIMPSLLRIFTTADNLVEFEPVGEEDVEQAAQESDYVNYVFFKKNPAFTILYTWFFDALVQKNGIVKAWWDEKEQITTESYQGLTEEELTELLDDDELEIVERDEREIELPVPDGALAPQTPTVTVHDVTFRRTSTDGRPRVEPVPPEEFRISSDARSLDPSEARMVGQEREVTRSDLIDMGFDKALVNELPAVGSDHRTREELARRDKVDDTLDAAHDKSQDPILVREAYIRLDHDGDGRSELRQVFTAGERMLSNEDIDRQPFHVISPQPLPHKHFGRATAEKVMDVQLVQSTLVRQILTNLYHTNNPGHAVWEQAKGETTVDDLLTTKAGRVASFQRPVNQSWAPMTVPFTAGATFPMLDYWEKVKRDRTGISSDGEGLNPEALKNIQTSVLAQATDLSKMKVETVARIFSETGIKTLFLHLHELLLKHQRKEEIILLRNRFVPVNPQEWRTRLNMTVKVGLGLGTREQNLLHLSAIWENQMKIVEGGGADLLVTGRNLYNTQAEFVKNANLKDPGMFFTDPGDQPLSQGDGQNQMAQAQLQLAQEQLRLQAQEQQNDRERNTLQHQREIEKIRIDQERAETDRQKVQNDLQVKLEEIANRLTEMDLKHRDVNVPGSRT